MEVRSLELGSKKRIDGRIMLKLRVMLFQLVSVRHLRFLWIHSLVALASFDVPRIIVEECQMS